FGARTVLGTLERPPAPPAQTSHERSHAAFGARIALPNDAISSRHELRQPFWGDEAIAPAREALDLAPIGLAVQSDANPALGAKIRWNEKSRRIGPDDDFARSFRDLAPEADPVVPRSFEGEDLALNSVRRAAPHRCLPRLGKREANGAQAPANFGDG